jgi:hypothetical protein
LDEEPTWRSLPRCQGNRQGKAKLSFPTREAATSYYLQLHAAIGEELNLSSAYECEMCGYFHLGTALFGVQRPRSKTHKRTRQNSGKYNSA